MVRVKNTFVMHSFYLTPPLEVNNRPVGRAHLKSEKLFFVICWLKTFSGKNCSRKMKSNQVLQYLQYVTIITIPCCSAPYNYFTQTTKRGDSAPLKN
jgi:hypothetical protein